MVSLWREVTSGVVKHGFVIEYRDLEPPRTGIFDGLRIVVDPDVGFEMQCFLLLHLFGHSVQWVAPSLQHKLEDLQHTDDKARFMQVLHDYEFEAAGFGLQLMHETRRHRISTSGTATSWRPTGGMSSATIETDALPPWETCVVAGAGLDRAHIASRRSCTGRWRSGSRSDAVGPGDRHWRGVPDFDALLQADARPVPDLISQTARRGVGREAL